MSMTSHPLAGSMVPELAPSIEHPSLEHAPVLTPPLLLRMQRLNLEYLQLLLEVPMSGPCAHADALPAATLQSLRTLPQAALQSLAAAPYALYTLGFEDQEFWTAMLGTAGPADSNVHAAGLKVADQGALPGDSGCRVARHAAFGEVVIFFAWHLAVANPLAARVMCGLPAAVAMSLQAAAFGRLQAVMHNCPWVLMPRWHSHLRFWPELLKFAASGELQALRQTQLLGNQLMACDLRLAESPTPELAARQRAVRTAQAQRWRLR
jgi:hypothetical protein